jgi:hypothetical protein
MFSKEKIVFLLGQAFQNQLVHVGVNDLKIVRQRRRVLATFRKHPKTVVNHIRIRDAHYLQEPKAQRTRLGDS